MRQLTRVGLLVFLAAIATACASGGAQRVNDKAGTDAAAASALVPIRNARIPIEGVLSGGQPTPEQIEAAARAGFRTVINLRTDGEPGFEWERSAVEASGMTYVQIPVAGTDGLTRENVTAIDEALREGLDAGPVLLHCGSGNRIGAVLALRAAWLEGIETEEALSYGLSSGLTRLEAATRELLEQPDP